MGSQRRLSGIGGCLLVGVLATACAATPGAPAPDAGPQRPSAVGDPLVVLLGPLEAPLVPDPLPAGLRVRAVTYNSEPSVYAGDATLYGDPDRADTLDGPLLVVGSSSGSA